MFMQNILLIVQDKKRGIAGSVGGFFVLCHRRNSQVKRVVIKYCVQKDFTPF